MLSKEIRQGFSLPQILTQILLATIAEREYRLLERERGQIAEAQRHGVEEALRRKREFVALLKERERADVRRSFPSVLADLPSTRAVPFSTAHTPTCYPVRPGVELALSTL
ncbi:MAG TPA: hypothetical protein VGB98_24785 [Pyrinomonadaceae bacterium]|jgi:hypothetical protein